MPEDVRTNLAPKRKLELECFSVDLNPVEENACKRIKLRNTTKSFSSLSPDSLFDEALFSPTSCQPAIRTAPPIPGLFYPSVRLPEDVANEVTKFCLERYFNTGDDLRVNQVMLFERAKNNDSSASSGLPPPLLALLNTLSHLLSPPALPSEIHELLFPSSSHSSSSSYPESTRLYKFRYTDRIKQAQARQAIINLYDPGEGISPHVDLLRRFGDGIVGVSLCGGCVMRFERVQEGDEDQKDDSDNHVYDVYLPPNSIIVLSGDARYKWTHGIERKTGDWVLPCGSEQNGDEEKRRSGGNVEGEQEERLDAEWIPRSTRLSITFRWLLPGADVVGGD
ncbi:hypothetical protein BT96DRAFT_914754 [Gymnopus androsaceus JB14]|uniref:Fe2OG dioxygenase domain-containing protein n=1 Tax=Gymnopus androsaceus JB14 TaxID=1447944 RepID=A0A6A4IEB2_9AGAR|nr:hypothetical protein BT96DRAFT_914754 [Gymnopus androsaceus JB14]